MSQQTLWHDTPEDALRALIDALGGPKRVGTDLYPDKPVEESRRLILKWCDSSRHEKPSLTQIMYLLRKGRDAQCHVLAAFLLTQNGYDEPRAVEPRDEMAALQRAYIQAAEDIKRISDRISRVNLRAAS